MRVALFIRSGVLHFGELDHASFNDGLSAADVPECRMTVDSLYVGGSG